MKIELVPHGKAYNQVVFLLEVDTTLRFVSESRRICLVVAQRSNILGCLLVSSEVHTSHLFVTKGKHNHLLVSSCGKPRLLIQTQQGLELRDYL